MDDTLGMDDLYIMPDNRSVSERGAALIATTSVFLFLALATTAARFYSRYLSSPNYKIEDWLILLGLCFTIATIGMSHALVIEGGIGHHAVDVSPHQLLWSLRLFVPTAIIWAVSTCLIKLSVLVFFVGVFSMPKVKYAVWIVIVLTSTIFIGVILQSTLLCQPFEYTWNKAIDGHCGNERAGYMSIAIVELCNELAIVILPMPVVWQLAMPVKRKIAVSIVMGLGLIVCAITAARIHAVTTLVDEDFTYTVVQDVILAALELELAIIVANLPLMRALMRKLFGTNGTFGVIWKRSSKEISEPASMDSEKALSARDRYYGKHSISSSSDGSSAQRSLHGSMSSVPGAPPMRVLSTDRYPHTNNMSSPTEYEQDDVAELETDYFPTYNPQQNTAGGSSMHSSRSTTGSSKIKHSLNKKHAQAVEPHSSFYATRYSQNANLQSPQHVHHAQGRDMVM